jgi:dihydrolipoamide dehydrogenase
MKDLVIIGGGPGGYVAAIRARQLGLDVTLVEKERLGGTCLNRGCIPTKAYYRNASLLHDLAAADQYSTAVEGIHFDLPAARERKNHIVNTLVSGVAKLINDNGIQLINGTAALLDQNRVEVGGQMLSPRFILLATGSVAARPPIPGAELPGVLDSTDILDLDEIPSRLAVIGGGVIGLELACIFNSFGSQVTVVENLPGILNLLDREIVRRMTVYIKKQKITLYTESQVKAIQPSAEGLLVSVHTPKKELQLEVDKVLVSAGRRPNTAGLNLDRAGVQIDERGFIRVNDDFSTSVPGIYAIGDVIGGPMLAHVASEEGMAAVENMAGENRRVTYHAVPSTIFTFPEIATVGLSEEECADRGIAYRVGKFPFAANGKALTMGETDGMVKVIADDEDTIVGVHIIGPHASDLILEGTLMVKNHMKVSQVLGTIHPHPTLGEAILEAILDLDQQAVHLSPRRGR